MTRSDAICVLQTIDRMRPPFVEWRTKQANTLAANHGTTAAEELKAMVDSFARTLADLDTAEVADVVDAMEVGRVPMPFWSELASSLRTAVLDDRRGRRDASRGEREATLRYSCLECRDFGAVTVYYPPFVEWLRPRFEAYVESGFPEGWYGAASREWYRKVALKEAKAIAEVSLACCCNCDNARIFQRQVATQRETRGTAKPIRAAHPGVWNPDRQPRVTGEPEADLAAWYGNHVAYEWTPSPGEYEERFR